MKELSLGVHFAWQVAATEAGTLKNQYIEKEHIFIGICSLEKLFDDENLDRELHDALIDEHNSIKDVLSSCKLNATELRRKVRERIGIGNYNHTEKNVHRSEDCKQIFRRADELVVLSKYTSCLYLFVAILESPGDTISGTLTESGIQPLALKERIMAYLKDKKRGNDKEPVKVHQGEPELPKSDTTYLDRYGRDLTREAQEGKLGPFVGRRNELLQIIQTLARSTKNNPVLVGEAGVGKTAIVEALAIRVAQGKDSHILGGKKIIELNMGALVGGTKYRGEFEERIIGIINEVRRHPEIIVFIDEIHNLVGTGRAEGSMDAANIIKPALARGELRCIGATTIAEYRRYIESDSALERRFEKVIVNEPSRDETFEILKGIRQKLEKHHYTAITDKALESAVDLSIRFDTDHQLPDKAIDLVDKAAARTRIPILSMKFGNLINEDKPKEKGAHKINGEVTELTIAEVLSDKVSVPLDVIIGCFDGMKQSRLLGLEKFLKNKLIGQSEAITRVCKRLLIAHSGLRKNRGPLAVFLFLGPTGVGKTELTKLIAEYLFGNASRLGGMIRLDMSEFMEEHSVAKLIGAPPGYIGYNKEGQLTGKLRTNPYSVVLLDEVEKAHPRIFDIFLQLFDEGRLTDAKGRTIDAKNAIFIMTSNIMPAPDHKQIGFKNDDNIEEYKKVVLQEVVNRFRPEFINRIDEQIVFRSLNEDDVRRILKPMLDDICKDVQEKYKVILQINEKAEKFLAHASYSPEYGAREVRRTMEKFIQVPMSQLILSGELKKHPLWQIVCDKQNIKVVPIKK